jgi:hypothetical protein
MNKRIGLVLGISAMAFSAASLAKDSDAVNYFDPHSSFEIVLAAPSLDAGARLAKPASKAQVKPKSLASSGKSAVVAKN